MQPLQPHVKVYVITQMDISSTVLVDQINTPLQILVLTAEFQHMYYVDD